MRERALLVGADLDVTDAPGGGTAVRLRLRQEVAG
jgi:signal transduction histidine kinase